MSKHGRQQCFASTRWRLWDIHPAQNLQSHLCGEFGFSSTTLIWSHDCGFGRLERVPATAKVIQIDLYSTGSGDGWSWSGVRVVWTRTDVDLASQI